MCTLYLQSVTSLSLDTLKKVSHTHYFVRDSIQMGVSHSTGIDYIPFQFSVDYTVNYTQLNETFYSNTTPLPHVVFLPRWLDGSSDPIPHSGLGVGTSTQTNIYVSHVT